MRRLMFTVETVAEGSGRLYVGGLVSQDLIRVGDRFTAAVPCLEPPGSVFPPAREVSLIVRGILTYGKRLNQICSGMSAELELEPLDGARPLLLQALVGNSELPPFEEHTVLGEGRPHVKPV
jgi:hypothetical protein